MSRNHFGGSKVITLWFRVKVLRAYGGFSEVFLKERAVENRSWMVIGFYCQVSVLVPFHFFALWEFVWGAFWTFIAAITALVQRPLLSWSLRRYFRWSKAKSIYCLHLRITIIQKQNIYTSIFSWSFPKSVEIGKEKYNYNCNHNSYASETPTSYSKFTLEVVDVSSNFAFFFRESTLCSLDEQQGDAPPTFS